MNESWIDCTGDAVTGDTVQFEKAVYNSSYKGGRYGKTSAPDSFETVTGKIIKDSYGRDKQQHTFTIETADGQSFRIKGRNLYRNGCKRLLWENEADREKAKAEKHERGDKAREARSERKGYRATSNGGYEQTSGGGYYNGTMHWDDGSVMEEEDYHSW